MCEGESGGTEHVAQLQKGRQKLTELITPQFQVFQQGLISLKSKRWTGGEQPQTSVHPMTGKLVLARAKTALLLIYSTATQQTQMNTGFNPRGISAAEME